MFELLRMFLEL